MAGLLIADPECPALDFEAESSLNQLQAASVHYRIAIGPHAGRKALTLYSVPPMEEASNIPLLAKVSGFSLHAATVCEAYQRSRLERLKPQPIAEIVDVYFTLILSLLSGSERRLACEGCNLCFRPKAKLVVNS
jgi:hypothetical protein